MAALAMEINGGRIRAARVALGGVAAKPWRAANVERILTGEEPSEELFQRAAQAAVEGAQPRGDNAFKVELIQRTLIKALRTLEAGIAGRNGQPGAAR